MEPSVAAIKLRDSPVAAIGAIFPRSQYRQQHLDKAVQRSAGAIAIGPVLQGWRKPVNYLGCTVADIVNGDQAQGVRVAPCW